MDLRTIQDWVVRRQLLGVKGVADVSSFGGYLKQFEVAVEPAKLKAYGITISDVFNALEKNNQNTGGAYIEKGPTVLYIRSEGLVRSIEDIKDIAVKNLANGTPLFIRDVADVRLGSATRYGAMCYNDKGEVAGAVVMMLKGGNSSQVIKDVKDRITLIQKTLPEGVEIEPFLDRTKMVNNAIGTVRTNLMEGALIVVFVLVFFLGNFRAGFLVASVIPLAMLFAVIMMNAFGVIGNLMSLGALDFGLIVDGAVFIVEAVLHHLHHSKHFSHTNQLNQQQMDEEVKGASHKMIRSVVFGQIIILVVYLPTFALQGIEGKMFKPMAQTVAFALLGAFLLSLTYVPMMSALFLSKKISHKNTISDRLMNQLERFYQHALEKALNFPKSLLGFVIALFVISLIVLSSMGGEFIPSLEEGDFAVDTRVLTGSNIHTTMAATQKAANILLTKFPEVQKVVTKIGSGEIPTDPMPMDASDMMVILKDKKEWTSAHTFPELAAKMSKELEVIPGLTAGFQFPVQMRFNELMTGARQDVVCKIYGENLDTLAEYAKKLGALASTVQGAKNIYVETVTGMPQILIEYNRAAIAQFGLNIEDVNRIVNTAFAGQSTGLVYEGEKRFDMVVRLNGDQRKNTNDVQNLLIPTPKGTQIPLYQLASVEMKEGPVQIQREDTRRRIIVGFNVGARDVQTIVTELQQKINKQIKLPSGYYITYGGAFENLSAAKQRLSVAVPIALLLIFLLLYFSFNSIKQGLLIYSAIPLSAIGGIFALALRGMPFSISAGVGFIALFGVAVLNGIVLIAEFNRLRQEGWKDLRKIVIMGTKIRLRPVVMTGFVASLGFLPMAISNGAGAEVQRPLATVVIGGLLIATLLTLFILPILYLLFEKWTPLSNHKAHAIPAILLLLTVSLFSNAQETISYQGSIDTALKNNLQLRNEKLQSDYLKTLKGTAWDIPQTNVAAEYGQINSVYSDSKLSVSQSIRFPLVYARQQSVLNQEWKNGLLNVQQKENELKAQVAQAFFSLLYLQQKRVLLIYTDSLYSSFLKNTELRFSKGESNILEKTIAENQRGQVQQQLWQIAQDYSVMSIRFKLLLNTDKDFIPSETTLKLKIPVLNDTAVIRSNPYLRSLEQQAQISSANLKLERSKLLPDLFLGYTNQSIVGLQNLNGIEKNFTAADRFSTVQFGIGLPIIFSGQKARISASKMSLHIASARYEAGAIEMESRYRQALQQLQHYQQQVEYYEKTALKRADTILESSNLQFRNGGINYIEWVLLMNQATALRSEYIDAIKSLNQSIIEINSLTNQ